MSETQRARLVRLLAVVSGATDAIGFLSLGGAFTSVMTGNMVLLGLGAGTRHWPLVLHAGLAIVAFVVGCVLGARIAGNPGGDDGIWPMQVTTALSIELCLYVVFAVGWEALSGHPGTEGWQMALLAVNALALGLQSSAIQRFGVSGLSTTYLTGTLTTSVIRLTSHQPLSEVIGSIYILLALITGALAGGALAMYAARFAPAIQILGILGVLLTAHVTARRVSDEHPHQRLQTANS